MNNNSKKNGTHLAINAENIQKTFGKGAARNHVLHGINLDIAQGEFVSIMGPSGCGKSTLLHILGLITNTDRGSVAINGEKISDTDQKQRTLVRRHQIGFVFQRFNLLGELNGLENVQISLKVRGMANGSKKHVMELFDTMGIAHVIKRKPGQMSIGEQQRVAVVRAIAHQPAILLADEPTGNLDTKTTDEILELLAQLNREGRQRLKEAFDTAEKKWVNFS